MRKRSAGGKRNKRRRQRPEFRTAFFSLSKLHLACEPKAGPMPERTKNEPMENGVNNSWRGPCRAVRPNQSSIPPELGPRVDRGAVLGIGHVCGRSNRRLVHTRHGATATTLSNRLKKADLGLVGPSTNGENVDPTQRGVGNGATQKQDEALHHMSLNRSISSLVSFEIH